MRTVLGVIAGFVAWFVLWVGAEQILSAIWPDWFGAHQVAFQAAIENGGQFTADTTILLIHIVAASIVSVISGRPKQSLPLRIGCRARLSGGYDHGNCR